VRREKLFLAREEGGLLESGGGRGGKLHTGTPWGNNPLLGRTGQKDLSKINKGGGGGGGFWVEATGHKKRGKTVS